MKYVTVQTLKKDTFCAFDKFSENTCTGLCAKRCLTYS